MAIGTVSWPRMNAGFLLISSLFIASSSAAITSQFQNFYEEHRYEYEYFLQYNCSQQFANYLTGRPQDFRADVIGGGGKYSVLVEPVVNCLLENASEYIKAASSSAQVLLGVTPPILATLGASTEELAMLSVIGRRPLLALLISFGNPSVYMERVFDFRQPANMLERKRGRYPPYVPETPFRRRVVAVMQYLIVLAAVANVATISWQLGLGTVCAWWSNTIFAPFVWTILSIPIHFAGVFAVRLRVRRIYSDEDKAVEIGFGQWLRMLPTRLKGYWKSEWAPAVDQDEIRIKSFEESKTYIAWSWLLSTATVIHILFGSLVLSGLLFIGPSDALVVIVRYVASVLACRILVTFELSGMRHRYIPESDHICSKEAVNMGDKTVRYRQGTDEEA